MRRHLLLMLDQLPPPRPDPAARAPLTTDAAALAVLLLDAYRGTIDDHGAGPAEAAAEIDRLFSGAYGPFNFPASEVSAADNQLCAATLVTSFQQLPLIAFSLTAPAWQRRGLARAGLIRTLHRLRAQGHREAHLAVTPRNTPAEHLYESLGFRPAPC